MYYAIVKVEFRIHEKGSKRMREGSRATWKERCGSEEVDMGEGERDEHMNSSIKTC
jgi:hypothetical protein